MYQANETNIDWNCNHITLTVEASGIDAAILGARNSLSLKRPYAEHWLITFKMVEVSTTFDQAFLYTLHCYKVEA